MDEAPAWAQTMFDSLKAQNDVLLDRIEALEQHSKTSPLIIPTPTSTPMTSMWDEAPAKHAVPRPRIDTQHPSKNKGDLGYLKHVAPPPTGKMVLVIGAHAAACAAIAQSAASNLSRLWVDLDKVVAEGGASSQAEAVQGALKGEHGAGAEAGTLVTISAGVMQSDAGRAAIAEWGISVHVEHHIDDFVEAHAAQPEGTLGTTSLAPGQSLAELHRDCRIGLEGCTKYTFTVCKGDAAVDNMETARDFLFFLRFICAVPNRERGFIGPDTFFLSLTYSNVREYIALDQEKKQAMVRGVDVVEFRADLLESHQLDFVRQQLALLRRHLPLPILFTVRTRSEGGSFEGTGDEMFTLLDMSRRAGCEIIDVEAQYEQQALTLMKNKGRSRIVVSCHVVATPHLPDEAELKRLFKKCAADGLADCAKVCARATCWQDNATILACAEEALGVPGQPGSTPYIGICFGNQGRISRVLNRIFSPVTHPALGKAAAPGQLTVAQVMDARRTMDLCSSSRRFYVFGHPVALSASPIIMNAGFKATGMPHSYYRYDTAYLEDVLQHLSLASTGGGSVTVPHKEGILPFMDELGEAAEVIGAVNTVTVLRNGKLRGDNTDWLGVRGQLAPLLAKRDSEGLVALICGAGGTARAACFAFQQMGFARVYIHNRTLARAAGLARNFNDLADTPRATKATKFDAVESMNDLVGKVRVDAVMSTLPGSANLVVPSEILTATTPVVIDAAYKSSADGTRLTALLETAKSVGCSTIEGMEMLFEQGCAQCELWTGQPAPRAIIAKALLDQRFADDADPPPNLVKEASAENL